METDRPDVTESPYTVVQINNILSEHLIDSKLIILC